MSLWESGLWWAMMFGGLIGSALYSGLETGSYRLNRVRLQILEHKGRRAAKALQQLLHQRELLLCTLLVGNNVANYMGTAGLAVILEDWGLTDTQVVLLNVLIITPLLLIFGETLPKDLFAAYGDRLMYRFAGFLQVSRSVFTWTGLLPLVLAVSHGLTRLMGGRHVGPFHPRRQVHALVQEGVGHGVLSDAQSAMVERVLELSGRCVADEMVAWKDVIRVGESDPPAVLWRLADQTSYSRFPVVNADGKVVGLLHLRDALTHTPDTCPSIRNLIAPVETLNAQTPLREALSHIQSHRKALAIVIRQGKPVGIVTIKDLIEPITGELASW